MTQITELNKNVTGETLRKQSNFYSTFLSCLGSNPIEIIDVGNRKQFNGYIEFIDPKEFKTSAAQGVDCFHRPFVCLKMLCTLDDGRQFKAYQTIFQRYNDNCEKWVVTGNSAGIIGLYGNLSNDQRQFVITLLKDKQVIISDQESREIYMFCRKTIGDDQDVPLWEKMTKVELVEFDTVDDAFICMVGDNIESTCKQTPILVN